MVKDASCAFSIFVCNELMLCMYFWFQGIVKDMASCGGFLKNFASSTCVLFSLLFLYAPSWYRHLVQQGQRVYMALCSHIMEEYFYATANKHMRKTVNRPNPMTFKCMDMVEKSQLSSSKVPVLESLMQLTSDP